MQISNLQQKQIVENGLQTCGKRSGNKALQGHETGRNSGRMQGRCERSVWCAHRAAKGKPGAYHQAGRGNGARQSQDAARNKRKRKPRASLPTAKGMGASGCVRAPHSAAWLWGSADRRSSRNARMPAYAPTPRRGGRGNGGLGRAVGQGNRRLAAMPATRRQWGNYGVAMALCSKG
jgi:hypothetical protein